MLARDTPMSDNGTMNDDDKPTGLEALEAALESADPAEAPEVAEKIAAELSEDLDATGAATGVEPTEEQPS